MTKISEIENPESIVTAIQTNQTFPEFVNGRYERYIEYINLFSSLIKKSNSSFELLEKIRNPQKFNSKERISLLKLFRRCVSTVIDTEKSKKIKNPTSMFIENYGHTFKDINILKKQFLNMTEVEKKVLTSLIGEYDDRGKQGYALTDLFFSWFENKFKEEFTIEGPRGAGKDIQLNSIFKDFKYNCPCDFIIRDNINKKVLAIGFARYDSTRGGSQSDDRTSGNNDKVMKINEFNKISKNTIKVIFISDGPGLTHNDTWEESCVLDGKLDDKVRVSTLKLAENRITREWLSK